MMKRKVHSYKLTKQNAYTVLSFNFQCCQQKRSDEKQMRNTSDKRGPINVTTNTITQF